MGSFLSRKEAPTNILLMGPQGTGKTTILYRLLLEGIITTTPTLGFNLETVSIDGQKLRCWDLGGNDKEIRPVHRHFFVNASGIVYVVDNQDSLHLEKWMDGLFSYFVKFEETRNFVCMVLANKQDLEGALSSQELEDAIVKKISYLDGCTQTVFVRQVSATAADGYETLQNAFRCLVQQIELKRCGCLADGLISVDSDLRE